MISDREIYQLFHNKNWIEWLDGQEIAYYDVDNLENQWILYKPKYTTDSTDPNRFKTQKNRKGDVLLRNKNKPIGFKLVDSSETDIDGVGRKYQSRIANETLREIFDGRVYDLKLYGTYGVVFGYDSDNDFYSVCFEIDGFITNDLDEQFVSLSVISTVSINSLYNYVDAIIYNGNFYTITFDGSTELTISKYNISFGVSEGSITQTFEIDSFDSTSSNDLSSLSYTPVSTREVLINDILTETIGRIWTTTYTDDTIYLAYECVVPTTRAALTGVTEGVGIIEAELDGFLDMSGTSLKYYVYDDIDNLPKVSDDPYCQAFIPDYADARQSFGHSITLDGDNLIVGSPEEDAIYVFDTTLTTTPDVFASHTTTLPSNGLKIEKTYDTGLTPVFPVRLSGEMDFNIFGDVNILWYYPDGTVSTNAHASGVLESVDTYYLFCDNFLDSSVRIVAGDTTGFIGSLGDIPNIGYYIDVSNTQASGHFGDVFNATYVNVENTNVSEEDLSLSAISLNSAGTVSGSLFAKEGLPDVTSASGVGAINALIAKGWNVSINMPFDDIDPMLAINGIPTSGTLDTFSGINEDPLEIAGVPTSGYIEYIVPDTLTVTGATTTAANGIYEYSGEQNSKPKWTKNAVPYNDVEFNTQWEIMHEIPASGTYYNNVSTDYIPNMTGWSNGDVGTGTNPTISYGYS